MRLYYELQYFLVYFRSFGRHRIRNTMSQKGTAVTVRHYPAQLRSTRSGGYAVAFPDFPYCVAAGATVADATAMAADVLAEHVDALLAAGASLPAPRIDQHAFAGTGARWILVPVGNPDTVDDDDKPKRAAEVFKQVRPLQELFPGLQTRPNAPVKCR
ncbi:type II toxin-antitoxin system HicB family antitoxin [Geminicoccus flavidas]|uniref:type II toxin-antitoxin system HicB family antitoxin n=1 Tax=Geminicoccus flavidas TaxID=2506407 RepID=UPI00135C8483|nr:type II toxin-antitoxin system HicB family antitoxin [Geminicoccus flavidas]